MPVPRLVMMRLRAAPSGRRVACRLRSEGSPGLGMAPRRVPGPWAEDST